MRRTGRSDITAMPFGIDTPTMFAMAFGVLGPVKLASNDPVLAWKVGMAVTLRSAWPRSRCRSPVTGPGASSPARRCWARSRAWPSS
jgi:hypothetical protein